MFNALIFMLMLCTINPLSSMEIIKEIKPQDYPATIINELFFAHHLHKQNILAKDIINAILQYSIAIKNRDFNENTHPFVIHWKDCRIPTPYYHLLRSNQIDLLKEMLTCQPLSGAHSRFQARMYYHLKSKKDYTLFLTLPLCLRECFKLLPTSMIQALGGEYEAINLKINPNITIQVQSPLTQIKHLIVDLHDSSLDSSRDNTFFGYKPKLMLPEEKKHSRK